MQVLFTAKLRSIMQAKTLQEKQQEASHWERCNRLGADGNRKPYGIMPLYHYSFGPYLLWIITGRYAPYSKITNVDELNRKLIEHFGLPFKKTGVIPHLQLLLAQDTDPLLFNPYRYLLDTIETENEELKDTSTQLQKVLHWLADSMQAADVQARQFHPVTYNVAAGYQNAVKDSAINKPEEVSYSRRPEPPAPAARPAVSISAATSPATARTPTTPNSMSDILSSDFTLDELDKLARYVNLVDEGGAYRLGERKLGAIVGFCQALKESRKLIGTIPELTAVIGPRYGVEVRTRKTTSDVAGDYYHKTKAALRSLKPIN